MLCRRSNSHNPGTLQDIAASAAVTVMEVCTDIVQVSSSLGDFTSWGFWTLVISVRSLCNPPGSR